jgi:hypothetical protein
MKENEDLSQDRFIPFNSNQGKFIPIITRLIICMILQILAS